MNRSLYCILFIYFSHHQPFRSAPSQPQQLTLCRSLHAEALQSTASEGLGPGPYVAVRAGFEPTTIRSKGINSTNAPPRPVSCTVLYPCLVSDLQNLQM